MAGIRRYSHLTLLTRAHPILDRRPEISLAEAEGIKPLIEHSPLMSWMYSFLSVRAVSSVIGVVEISVALLMALRPISPKASFVGSLGAIITFLTTVSFLFTTPGVLDHSNAVPLLGGVGGFLIKDLALLGCAVWTRGKQEVMFFIPP